MKRAQILCALAGLALFSGCYTTTLRSGKPVSATPSTTSKHWHSGVLGGGVELSGPYELKRICPHGWSEIETETSVFSVIAEFATFHLYAPQTVRVRCAENPAQSARASTPTGGG